MNAEYIELNLLHQLRLITVGHVFPVWVQKTCIFVKAGKLHCELGVCCRVMLCNSVS